MIIDNIKNKEIYYALGDGFKLGFDFIDKAVKENLEVGRYELDGNRVFALVQEYDSKTEGKLESHDNYIDIQYIISGEEEMFWQFRENYEETIPYNPEKDITFYKDNDVAVGLKFKAGDFAVFYPIDIHKPGMKIAESVPVRKIVVKIHI